MLATSHRLPHPPSRGLPGAVTLASLLGGFPRTRPCAAPTIPLHPRGRGSGPRSPLHTGRRPCGGGLIPLPLGAPCLAPGRGSGDAAPVPLLSTSSQRTEVQGHPANASLPSTAWWRGTASRRSGGGLGCPELPLSCPLSRDPAATMDGGHFLAQLSCRQARLQDDPVGKGEGPLPPRGVLFPSGTAQCGLLSGTAWMTLQISRLVLCAPKCAKSVLSRPGCCLRWSRQAQARWAFPGHRWAARLTPSPGPGEGWGCGPGWVLAHRCWGSGPRPPGGAQHPCPSPTCPPPDHSHSEFLPPGRLPAPSPASINGSPTLNPS